MNALILMNSDEGEFQQNRSRNYEKKADVDFEAHLIALSCGEPPKGHYCWSLRLLSDKVVELKYIDVISHETVRQVLKKTKSSLGKRRAG